MNLFGRCRATMIALWRSPVIGNRMSAYGMSPWSFMNSSHMQCRYKSGNFYRKRSYKYTRAQLLPPKSPSSLTTTEQQIAVDPLVSLLKSPLRLCMFSRRIQPSGFMIRFIHVRDNDRDQTWLVPDGIGGQPRRGGIGHWVSARRTVMNMLNEKYVQARITGNGFIRPDMADFIDSLLAHDIALELRRCIQACIIKQLRLQKLVNKPTNQEEQEREQEQDGPALIKTGKSVVNQPNPCLFKPMPDALFDTIDMPWSATTPSNHSAYLVIPPEPLELTKEQDNIDVTEHCPVFNLGRMLNAQDIRMVRAALGLRKSSQHTLNLAVLYSGETTALVMALWRWHLYQQ
ncbi:hypothetical protein BDF22DRAFT_667937 [Syncephalis plumigaleata]|nr:hypothetical protein BDF22DRAFT_667937 [Syncephalis plumigaleata]